MNFFLYLETIDLMRSSVPLAEWTLPGLSFAARSSPSLVKQHSGWNYFVKIVAAPADATLDNGVWYAADGVEIGPEIWGEFAVIQEVSNDSCAGEHGLLYLSPDHAGLGNW